MVCLGFKPGVAGWKAQTNPLSYDCTPRFGVFFKKNGPILHVTLQIYLIKAKMVCLGFKPGVAGWKAQTNPLSYDCTPRFGVCTIGAECSR